MKEIRLIMLGFGDAGRAFVRLLEDKKKEIAEEYKYEIKVVAITTRSRGSLFNSEGLDTLSAANELEKLGSFDKEGEDYSELSSLEALSSIDYDAMLELTPLDIFTGQPAKEHITIALNRGKHVITANKGPLAWAYSELKELADKKGVKFLFETTVMDGSPIFNLMKETLPLCKVIEIKGILNSTTNYILVEMAKGKKYSQILEEGRDLGFVEANPAMDIEGWDASAKIATLMNVLMDANITPMDIQRKGIEDITYELIDSARADGKLIKLICHARIENDKFVGSVGPELIPKEDLLAGITGTTSMVSITTDLMKTVTIVEHDPGIEQTAYGPFVDLLKLLES